MSLTALRAESGRIVPGTLLADRYRIVALIGRGGMGEVYRAEDLKLDEDVALKFLPEKLVQDGAALARFHREVRIAREISHPNVCRVFDIGESNGVPFISMEYVDGEDLSTLLRRIGRLPQDKAIEIVRQICAGVSAAHEHGVLHRDLKPANIMLDGRGKVRIMDFGLAGVSAEIKGAEITSGTPAYMAPEQLSGKEVTIRSDIYSLGLVSYEVFTGKRAFDAASVGDLMRLREHSSPTNPSQVVHDLDPLVERVVMRCLENDPERRPKTALQIAAALPGGDPLAAALAAGETPSPQMVAAAGGEQALSPRNAWILFAAVALALIAVLWVARYATDLALYPIDKSPEVLEDRARQIAIEAGYPQATDKATWFSRNYGYLLYRNRMKMSAPKGPISGSNPGALSFAYRQSPDPMIPAKGSERVEAFNPPYETSGIVLVGLDSLGRLREFRAVPQQDATAAAVQEPNWAELFREAGLDLSRFKPAQPKWLPSEPFDLQRDWEGTYEGDTTPIHVSAASYRGKPVWFRVIAPWITSPDWSPQKTGSHTGFIQLLSIVGGGLAMIIIAAVFARKNIRLGRGDRKGAFRLAGYFLVGDAVARLLQAHHVPTVAGELDVVTFPVALALLGAVVLWIYYVAMEPYVRRQWPEFLISWTRLLGGNFRDPMVGRDLLAGCLFGALLALCEHVVNALPAWFNLAGQTPINGDSAQLGSAMQFAGSLFQFLAVGVFRGLTVLFLYVLLRSVIKSYWGSAILLGVLVTLTYLGNENPIAETIGAVIMAVLTVTVLLRFGLLALAAAITALSIFLGPPVALDPQRWYFTRGLIPVLIFVAVAIFGLRTSVGRQSLFGKLTEE